MTVIIGIDPGLNNTGWAVIEVRNSAFRLLNSGVVRTNPKDNLPNRLLKIHDELEKILVKYRPDLSAIEETFVNDNYGSSIKLSHARAAAIVTLSRLGVVPTEYAAKVIKKAVVGNGNADKNQVHHMLKVLMPTAQISSNDASDAAAVAICHANYSRL